MNDAPAPKGRPPKARNAYQKRSGIREREHYTDRYSWSRFRNQCDDFLRSRGLKPD